MPLALNKIHQGDCVALLKKLDAGSVDLAFADPPFNISYEYDVYKDKRPYEEYLDWTREWMGEVSRVLKPTGTFWVAIGDEYAAEFKLILQNELKLTCRSWVIWYYTFGVNCKYKFTRSHAHLFHFVKDAKKFTFNALDPNLRIPSARQLVYGDKRAVKNGRLPDDTWILRPQDVPDGFEPDSDTWYFSRVAGTFKERQGFHGCQMPEQLLGRIIRASSKPGDLVLDPFAGSATTIAVAKKLGREYIGCELSKKYAIKGNARLDATTVGESLSGAENPLLSAPKTSEGRRLADVGKVAVVNSEVPVASRKSPSPTHSLMSLLKNAQTEKHYTEIELAVINAFLVSHAGFSADRVVLADPDLNAAFIDACTSAGIPGKPADWNRTVLRLRKANKLPGGLVKKRITFHRNEMDEFSFASEIAWEQIREKYENPSLDEILSDPKMVKEFDRIANRFAPGFSPMQYRWAALALRKDARLWRGQVDKKQIPRLTFRNGNDIDRILKCVDLAVYVLRDESGTKLYAGETLNIGRRFRKHLESAALPFVGVAIVPPVNPKETSRKIDPARVTQFALIEKFEPSLNLSQKSFAVRMS